MTEIVIVSFVAIASVIINALIMYRMEWLKNRIEDLRDEQRAMDCLHIESLSNLYYKMIEVTKGCGEADGTK